MSDDAISLNDARRRRSNLKRLAQPEWMGNLLMSEKGKPYAIVANAIIALGVAPEWEGVLQFDTFHQKTVVRGKAPWMAEPIQEEWGGDHDVLAADWLQHHRIHVSPDVAAQAVETVARRHPFHPVQDYLNGCIWDGERRLDGWAQQYLGATSSAFTAAATARWMIAAVARVFEPGCKFDHCLILEGKQGSLKSSALRTLADPWFVDELSDVGTKDASLQLAGAWVIELAELDSMSRVDVSKIKAFMSRTTDRYRPPYGRRAVEVPRQCVFSGSVNLSEYLRDETGARRFWPVACNKINLDGLATIRDQLWGEARDRYLAAEPYWINTAELAAAAHEAQGERYEGDPWEEPIREYAKARETVTVADVLEGALSKRKSEWAQADQNRVARCLRALGFERFQIRDGSRRTWAYRRASPVETSSPDGAA